MIAFQVFITPRWSEPEIAHCLPFTEKAQAFSEGALMVQGGNYAFRVATIDTETGETINRNVEMTERDLGMPPVGPEYLDHEPLI